MLREILTFVQFEKYVVRFAFTFRNEMDTINRSDPAAGPRGRGALMDTVQCSVSDGGPRDRGGLRGLREHSAAALARSEPSLQPSLPLRPNPPTLAGRKKLTHVGEGTTAGVSDCPTPTRKIGIFPLLT